MANFMALGLLVIGVELSMLGNSGREKDMGRGACTVMGRQKSRIGRMMYLYQ